MKDARIAKWTLSDAAHENSAMNSDGCDFLNFDELCAALSSEGVEVTRDQLRSWSQKGLIPRAKSSGNRRYARSSIPQIAECARLMREKRDAKHAGWMLWFHGYEVSETYWQGPLGAASKTLKRLKPLAKLNANSNHDEDAFSYEIQEIATKAQNKLTAPVSTNARCMSESDKQESLIVLLTAVAGAYTSGDLPPPEETHDSVVSILGGKDAKKHVIKGQAISFGQAINEITLALASMPNAPLNVSALGSNELAKLKAARDDVRNVFEATIASQKAFNWLFGKSALGLRTFGWIARKRPTLIVAAMILSWHAIRKHSEDEFLNSMEIAALRDKSLRTRNLSMQLKTFAENTPELAEILTPKKLPKALKSEQGMEKLVSEISRIMCNSTPI